MKKLFKIKEEPKKLDSFQDWLQLKSINNNKIILNEKNVILLRVSPINFKLKSTLEQSSILNQYKLFLKNLNSKIQIIILSKKTDISYHLEKLLKATNEGEGIIAMKNDYINLLKSIVREKGSITKEFYISVEENPNIENEVMKIKEYLNGCGNEVEKCSNEEIQNVLRHFVNKRICNLT